MSIKSDDPTMLPSHVGIGSNDPSAGRSRPNPGSPRFSNDHQIPGAEQEIPGLPRAAIEKGPDERQGRPLSNVQGGIPKKFSGI